MVRGELVARGFFDHILENEGEGVPCHSVNNRGGRRRALSRYFSILKAHSLALLSVLLEVDEFHMLAHLTC